jgi:crotonobetainyl-CoA:carnitine CoA-transferase CaiB-like acyl-CoA transferase
MSSSSIDLPLSGIRVLDLADGPLQTVGRLFADLGADVVRVEPPEGSADRRSGVLLGETSVTFELRNVNKRSMAVGPDDRDEITSALAGADIVLTSRENEFARGSGLLSRDRLQETYPDLIVLSLSDFGLEGPRSEWQGTPAVHFALAGILARSGQPNIPEPLLPPEFLAYEAAAVQAFWVALLALTNRARSGVGDFIDFSVSEGLVHILDPAMGVAGSARAGQAMRDLPRGRPDVGYQYPIFKVKDGWVRICLLGVRQWQGMFTWLGEPEAFADPIYNATNQRFRAAGTLYPLIADLLAGYTRAEATAAGQTLGVPIAEIASPAEALDTAAFREAGAFDDLTFSDGTRLTVPSGWFEIDGERVGIRHRAPELGDSDVRTPAAAPLRDSFTPRATERPFDGIRVLDLGVIVVGAELGRLFADYGADVIKIESTGFPDGSRQSALDVEMSESAAWGHRNKRSLGLNLKSPEGKQIFRRLVAEADVVLTNFKPGTLTSLGFGYDELAAINPGIVLSESSAFGNSGPWATRLGYGPLVRASAGMTALWRYPDADDGFSDAITVFPDHVVARLNAAAVAALLLRRERTGRGGRVSTAQVDAIFGAMGDWLAVESVRPGRLVTGAGLVEDAPRGVFPAEGDDEWLVIDGAGDERFARLAAVIGHPEWRSDPRFDSASKRMAESAVLDAATAEWTRQQPPREAMLTLQAAGVPAAQMLRVQDLETDDSLIARNALGLLRQPQIADPLTTLLREAPARNLPEPRLEPAPLLAEHSREIMRSVLGLPDSAIDDLLESGALELHPSAKLVATHGRITE